MSGIAGRSGRPTIYKVAQREKFLFSAIEELNKIIDDHKSGKKVLTIEQLLQLCLPMTLKDMANKLDVNNLNELSGDQKFELINKYIDTLKSREPLRLIVNDNT
jgi:hypothetical protein